MSETRKASTRGHKGLKPIRRWVAGIDVGSKEYWVCGPEDDDGEREVRVFGVTTPEIEKMATWLRELHVESVAMESTHVYWVPVYELLESVGFEVLLADAKSLKHVPGRKTDMHDCQWLQLLHSCGLLRGSFRPTAEVCRLRALRRQRSNLVEERARCIHWMQKALDQMNVRVHQAVTDITGVTGMKIIRAVVEGERDPLVLASLRDHRCKKSEKVIAEHLTGSWREEHLFNLKSALALYDYLNTGIDAYDVEMARVIAEQTPEERAHEPAPVHHNHRKATAMRRRGEEDLRAALYRYAGKDLTTIDGISPESARVILTEIGPDVSAFHTEKHFVSWLRLCPRTAISGGKPLKGKKKNSLAASRVGSTLRLAAATLARSQSALGAKYRRIASRKSAPTAIFAVARQIAVFVYRLLRYGTTYTDIGAAAYEERFEERRLAALTRNATELGLKLVPLEMAPAG